MSAGQLGHKTRCSIGAVADLHCCCDTSHIKSSVVSVTDCHIDGYFATPRPAGRDKASVYDRAFGRQFFGRSEPVSALVTSKTRSRKLDVIFDTVVARAWMQELQTCTGPAKSRLRLAGVVHVGIVIERLILLN